MNTRKSHNVAQTYKDIKGYEFVLKAFIALERKMCTVAGVTVRQGRVPYADSSGSGTSHRRVTLGTVIEVARSLLQAEPARPLPRMRRGAGQGTRWHACGAANAGGLLLGMALFSQCACGTGYAALTADTPPSFDTWNT